MEQTNHVVTTIHAQENLVNILGANYIPENTSFFWTGCHGTFQNILTFLPS